MNRILRMMGRIPYPERPAVSAILALLTFEIAVVLLSALSGLRHEVIITLCFFLVFHSIVGVYCLYRHTGFHPWARPEYQDWLKSTPWYAPLPLPLGPVLLRWNDLLMYMAFLVIGTTHLVILSYRLFTLGELLAYYMAALTALMLIFYLLPVAATLMHLRERRCAYLILFLLGLACWLYRTPLFAVFSLATALPISQYGLRRSLKSFPWEGKGFAPRGYYSTIQHDSIAKSPGYNEVGWPYAGLAPVKPDADDGGIEDSLCVAILAGWTFYVAASFTTEQRETVLWFIYGMICAIILLQRIARYTGWCWSSHGVLTRLAMNRWIVPKYDKVYLTPIAAMILAVAGPLLLLKFQATPLVAAGISLTLTTLTVLVGGPTLSHWRLTGEWRMFPPAGSQLFPPEKQVGKTN